MPKKFYISYIVLIVILLILCLSVSAVSQKYDIVKEDFRRWGFGRRWNAPWRNYYRRFGGRYPWWRGYWPYGYYNSGYYYY